MCGRFGTVDGDTHFARMKGELDLSVRDFQRSFYTYRRPFWQTPVLRLCTCENRRVGGLLMQIGNENFTQLNAPLNLKPMDKALSVNVLYILKTMVASSGGLTMLS
jgi:hypothetical protein